MTAQGHEELYCSSDDAADDAGEAAGGGVVAAGGVVMDAGGGVVAIGGGVVAIGGGVRDAGGGVAADIFLIFEYFLDPRSSEPSKVEPRTSEVPLYLVSDEW